jgi:hypothetical protein
MSIFAPNQVEELIIGNAVASETTLATFIASASDQEIKVLSADGSAPASGENFKVYQKTGGSSSKGLNYEFSDIIKANKVEKVILKEYSAEVNKSVTATVGSASANTAYSINIRLYNDGGSLSPENFTTIVGTYTTGASAGTVQAIRDGLITSLNYNLTKRGAGEFVVAANSTNAIDITGAAQIAVPGKIVGRQIEFEVIGKSFTIGSPTGVNTGAVTVVTTAENYPGNGTGKYAVNLEWFTKGYKYDVSRQYGYPADFTERTPFYASAGSTYNAIHIKYKESRISPTVEEQPKVLTILVAKTNLASNAVTNAVLADLRTILGSGNVPANLATA